MLGNVRGRNWCDSPPAVAQNESRHSSRKSDPSSQNGAGDGGNERGARLAGVLVFSGCAAAVRLRLADDAPRCGALRVSLVHRACALGAARHARFRRRRPPGANHRVTGRNENGQRKREQLPAESQHTSRMQDRATSVKLASIWRLFRVSRRIRIAPFRTTIAITVATTRSGTGELNNRTRTAATITPRFAATSFVVKIQLALHVCAAATMTRREPHARSVRGERQERNGYHQGCLRFAAKDETTLRNLRPQLTSRHEPLQETA